MLHGIRHSHHYYPRHRSRSRSGCRPNTRYRRCCRLDGRQNVMYKNYDSIKFMCWCRSSTAPKVRGRAALHRYQHPPKAQYTKMPHQLLTADFSAKYSGSNYLAPCFRPWNGSSSIFASPVTNASARVSTVTAFPQPTWAVQDEDILLDLQLSSIQQVHAI